MITQSDGSARGLKSDRARSHSRVERAAAEWLEPRQLLAAVPMPWSGGDESAQVIENALVAERDDTGSANRGIDAGDFYWADGRKVSLLRATDEVVVKLRRGSSFGGLANAMSARAGACGGFHPSISLTASLMTLSASAVQGIGADHIGREIDGLSDVEWTAPVFIHPQDGSRIVPTDEIVVALTDGIDPRQFFAVGFSEFRRLLGTTDEYVATVTAGGGMGALTVANQLNATPAVRWAAPNFYMEMQLAFDPDDPLYGQQWGLNNANQTGARENADANLREAWDVTRDGSDVVIAVLDNGVQLDHADLIPQRYLGHGGMQQRSISI